MPLLEKRLLLLFLLILSLSLSSVTLSEKAPRRWENYRKNYNEYFQNQQNSYRPSSYISTSEASFIRGEASRRTRRHDNWSENNRAQSDQRKHVISIGTQDNDLAKLIDLENQEFRNWETKICRSCGVALLQDSYCKEDFVVKAYVYNVSRLKHDEHQYLIYVNEIYKDNKPGTFNVQQLANIVYHCDKFQAGLQVYETYFITGYYDKGKAFVDSCSWKKRGREVTYAQMRFLERRYQRNCPYCTIERVMDFNPRIHQENNKCYVSVNPRSNEAECRDRYSFCRYEASLQTCQFFETPRYKYCLNWLYR